MKTKPTIWKIKADFIKFERKKLAEKRKEDTKEFYTSRNYAEMFSHEYLMQDEYHTKLDFVDLQMYKLKIEHQLSAQVDSVAITFIMAILLSNIWTSGINNLIQTLMFYTVLIVIVMFALFFTAFILSMCFMNDKNIKNIPENITRLKRFPLTLIATAVSSGIVYMWISFFSDLVMKSEKIEWFILNSGVFIVLLIVFLENHFIRKPRWYIIYESILNAEEILKKEIEK